MLKGKSALVTGSTSGIGRGIAEALADQGVNVMLNGFGDAGEIESLRADLQARSGGKALYSAADMTRPAEIADMVRAASAHSLVASPFKAAYVAAKHGIAGLTKTVALECAEAGITVNAISPGYVLTPLVQAQIPDTARARGITEDEVKRDVLLAAQPTKTFVGIDEVAGTALFLCSDAAANITGANISIDGGWTAK